jgi:hypothetical protein
VVPEPLLILARLAPRRHSRTLELRRASGVHLHSRPKAVGGPYAGWSWAEPGSEATQSRQSRALPGVPSPRPALLPGGAPESTGARPPPRRGLGRPAAAAAAAAAAATTWPI